MTVKGIAALAGVSIGTVDRVLHGRGRVSAQTKAAVEEIVARSGFRPNAVARRLRRGRPYRFAVLLPERREDSGYWGQARDGVESAADEIRGEGIETEVREFDRYSADGFRAAADAALDGEPDGLLLAPVVPREARRLADRLDGKVPYAFFDADLPGTSPVCAIGQDPYAAGLLAGRLAELFSCGGGRFAVVDAHSEDFHIRRRREGFLAYAAARGFPTVAAEDADLEDAAAAEALTAGLQRAHPDLAGVFVSSASTHRIAASVRGLRALRRFVVVGFDLVPENERLLREGAIDAVISQRPESQAGRGLLALYRSVVLGEAVERRVEMPIDLYLKENVPPAGGRAPRGPGQRSRS